MKKLVLIFALIFMSAISYLNAQVIEDFESITMNIFSAGTNGMISVVANPDTAGNQSLYVGKMVRGFDGDPWAGWYATLPTAIDITANPYVHIKVWKPRISPVVFKVEEGAGNSNDVSPINPQTLTDQWEELVFDMSTSPATGEYVKIVLIPDFEDPLTLTEDITLYFDDMYVNNDPVVGSDPVQVMENFETIPLNYMLGGAEDMSYMELIPNPDPTEVNLSPYVIHYLRDKDGVPWGGFWSDVPVDFTDNKYVHVKVWKPRISPIKFKVENPGVTDPIEVASMNEQTVTDGWQDMVFDFSSTTGVWPRIAFFPDFEDPLTLTEDITIYFDDILVSDDPTPIGFTNVSITLDMTDAIGYVSEVPFDPALHDVFIAGDFAGWSTPGSDPTLKFTTVDNVHYTLNLFMEDGHVQFKFFFVPMGEESWDNGEWSGTDNRHLIIMGGAALDLVWGDRPALVTFNVDMTNADPFNAETDDIYIAGELLSTWNQPGTVADYKLEPVAGKEMIYTLTLPLYEGDHMYKYFRVIDDVPSWDNGEWAGGTDRLITVDTVMTVNDVWGSPAGIYNHDAITFNIYPNPVNEYLTVDNLGGADKIEIFSLVGEKIRTIENISTNSVIVNTSDLSKGMYLITVNNKGVVQATKFMK